MDKITEYYESRIQKARTAKEKIIYALDARDPQIYLKQQDNYHNEAVGDIVKNIYMKQVVESDGRLIKQRDPIFRTAEPSDIFSFRCHFYAPQKHFFGIFFDTYWFNITIVWIMTLFLYVTLYYDLLKKLLDLNIGKAINKVFPKIQIKTLLNPVISLIKKIKVPRIIIRFRKK